MDTLLAHPSLRSLEQKGTIQLVSSESRHSSAAGVTETRDGYKQDAPNSHREDTSMKEGFFPENSRKVRLNSILVLFSTFGLGLCLGLMFFLDFLPWLSASIDEQRAFGKALFQVSIGMVFLASG
ncbi:MAG: hypothetical protein WC655_16375, partial [Candidatus Hydrogenedentales bacterium]